MATAFRAERPSNLRVRAHADGGLRARPMVRSTVGVVPPSTRSHLTVVPRRRRAARLVTFAAFVITSLMLGAAAFQTQLARRQVDIDRINSQVRVAHNTFNALREQRAQLRSTERLATMGTAMGMHPAGKTDFVDIPADVVAEVQQSAGGVFDPEANAGDPVFEEFKVVKSIVGG